MSEESRRLAEDFGTQMLVRKNAPRWGYSRVGFLSDGITHAVGSTMGYRPVFQCDHCGCLIGLRGGGPFGDRCPLAIHSIHCAAISFGIRYTQATRRME